jgi:hypothetical protein
VLAPLRLREVQQLVGLDRVRVLQQVEAVLESGIRGDAGDLVEHLRTRSRGMPLSGEEVQLVALEVDRCVGRQLERVEGDLDLRRVSSSAVAARPLSRLRLPM